jgi:hypothetical protein
MGGIRSFKK